MVRDVALLSFMVKQRRAARLISLPCAKCGEVRLVCNVEPVTSVGQKHRATGRMGIARCVPGRNRVD